jgi:hypothetical protein
MSSSGLMTNRCTVQRNTPTDASGKIVPAWADLATDVRCLIQEGAGRFYHGKSGTVLEFDAVGFFLPTQDLRPRAGQTANPDVIVMTAPAAKAGSTYIVLLAVDESGMADHLTAYLKQHSAVT